MYKVMDRVSPRRFCLIKLLSFAQLSDSCSLDCLYCTVLGSLGKSFPYKCIAFAYELLSSMPLDGRYFLFKPPYTLVLYNVLPVTGAKILTHQTFPSLPSRVQQKYHSHWLYRPYHRLPHPQEIHFQYTTLEIDVTVNGGHSGLPLTMPW